MKLTNDQKQALYEQGFVHLPGIVPQEQVHAALRSIHSSIGSKGIDPAQLPIFRAQTYCPELRQTEPITNLFNASPLRNLAESAIGVDKLQPVTGGQIALRFPTMDTTPRKPGAHIDGMPSPTNGVKEGRIENFTALVGVFLSDIPHEYMGNLTLWPGTHHLFGEYFRQHSPQSLLHGMPPIEMPESKQITAKPGDAVLCHYLLGHGIAGNISPFIRYAVFFRLFHKNLENWRLESMIDPWLGWEGMQEIAQSTSQP